MKKEELGDYVAYKHITLEAIGCVPLTVRATCVLEVRKDTSLAPTEGPWFAHIMLDEATRWALGNSGLLKAYHGFCRKLGLSVCTGVEVNDRNRPHDTHHLKLPVEEAALLSDAGQMGLFLRMAMPAECFGMTAMVGRWLHVPLAKVPKGPWMSRVEHHAGNDAKHDHA